MADLAQISALIVEAAGLDDEIAAVIGRANDSWIVRFQSIDIEIGVDDQRGRLILVTVLGAPDQQRRLAVIETLLAYNFLVRETGGVRIATNGVGGELVQMADIGIAGLSARDLVVVLTNMAEKTLAWRAFIALNERAAGAPAASPDSLALRL